MVCSAAAGSVTRGPSAGTGFPFEPPLQAGTRTYLSEAAVALLKDLFMCVDGLCYEAVL